MESSAFDLLARLESISRARPDRVLRLRGVRCSAEAGNEPYELLLFRGFSSSTTHPTGFDPDQPVLPDGVTLATAELLAAPLDPSAERLLAAALPPAHYLQPAAWL